MKPDAVVGTLHFATLTISGGYPVGTPMYSAATIRKWLDEVTETDIDVVQAFAAKGAWLHHPDVPYHGTANGDSEESWNRRYCSAMISAMIAAKLQELEGGK